MAKRFKMSRGASRANFRRGATYSHKKNFAAVFRGGIRL